MAQMKALLKYTVGALLLIALLRFIDWRQSAAILLNTNPLPVLLVFLLLSGLLFLSTFRWYILLRAQGISVPLVWLLKCYWISSFFSNYFPSNVGGDVVRLMMMHHLKSSAQVAASIFLERLTGFIVLLGFAALSLLMRPEYFLRDRISPVFWILAASLSVIVVLLFLFKKHIKQILIHSSNKWGGFPAQIITKMNKFFVSLFYFREQKRAVALTLVLSIPFYCVVILCQYLIFLAIGRPFPLQKVFFVAPLIPLVSALPISPNGLGVAEAAFVVFYVQAGMAPEVALAASVVRRVVNVLVSLVGGIIWLAQRSKPKLLVK
jgi:uncharacterized protein (TIRG00374 family)